MVVYITGANGRLGRDVMEVIPSAIGLVRKKSRSFSKHKRCIETDYSFSHLKSLLEDADVIIHTAGSTKFWDKEDLFKSNYELTKKLVLASPKNVRFIYVSSVSVFGKKEGIIDDSTKAIPVSDYAKSKFLGEQEVMKKEDHVILRVAAIYGPQYPDYVKFINKIKDNKFVIPGDGMNHVPFVHVRDVSLVCRNAIKKGHGKYIISGEAKRLIEIYSTVCSLLNIKQEPKFIPKSIAYFFAFLEELKTSFLGGKPKITQEHVKVLTMDRIFVFSKAIKELSFSPRPLRQGIKEIITSGGIY